MKKLITLIFLFSFFSVAQAQPLPPSGVPVPLDGGLLTLLAAGAVYGTKKYHSVKRDLNR
jgi:hypothetical protein